MGNVLMRTFRTGLATAVLCMLQVAAAAAGEFGWTADSAVAQIDRQARDFDAAFADFQASWQKPGADQPHRTATGRLYISRDGGLRFEQQVPDQRTMLVAGNELHDYDSVRAVVDVYPLEKHRERLAPYARVGFTTTAMRIRDDYLVTMLGEDYVNGRRIIGLELTPTKASTRETVARLQVWVDLGSWLPVKQVIVNVASGETLTITYNGMVRNPGLDPALFEARWPRRTKKIAH